MNNNRILISVGEASGDLHAANLVQTIHAAYPHVQFYGMGGSLMRAAGVKTLIDIKDIALIGALKIITNFYKIFSALRTMKRALKVDRPDLLILVDYAEFNFRLAKYAHKLGIKVLYYISPKIWAWRQYRVKKIQKNVDLMAVIFPFEVEFYKKWHVPVAYVGNSLLDTVNPTKSIEAIKLEYGLNPNAKIIGLMPGSRHGEIEKLLPVMLSAAQLLQQNFKDIQFVLPLASSLTEHDLTPHLQKTNLKIKIIKNDTYNAAKACNAVIVASGTATLETALLATPMVIIYKLANFEFAIAKRIIKVPFIGLCNILAQEVVAPELIQDDANPQKIAAAIAKILNNQPYREIMENKLNNIRAILENYPKRSIVEVVASLLEVGSSADRSPPLYGKFL